MADYHNILVSGYGGVGKTAITIQLCENYFASEYDPNMESPRKQLLIDGQGCLLVLLDEFGETVPISQRDQWIRECNGFIIVYSVTSRISLDQVADIRNLLFRVKGRNTVPLMLVGNKCDETQNRQISTEEGEELAQAFGCQFKEASAKTSENIQEIFCDLVRDMRNSNDCDEICQIPQEEKCSLL